MLDSNRSSSTNGDEPTIFYRLLTSMLLFGLLAEWLLPWINTGEWGAFYQLGPLLVVMGCTLVLGLFRPQWYASLLVNGVLCLLSLMWLYKSADESALQWWTHLPGMLWGDIYSLFTAGLWTMSGELRTLMLFIGFAMLAPALQALIWMRQLALGLAALTAVYLLLLHTWLGMDILNGLMRLAAEGLLLAAIVTIARVQRVHGGGSEFGKSFDPKWLASSLFAVLLLIMAGQFLSEGKPAYSEPAQWTASLTSRLEQTVISLSGAGGTAAQGRINSDVASTGYGFDDSELGAALAQDDTLVFTGLSPVRTYWRGEAKNVYDGRGWSSEWSSKTLHPVESGEQEALLADKGTAAPAHSVSGKSIVQTVIVKKPTAGLPLFTAGSSGNVLNLVASDPRRKLNTYISNDSNGALYAGSETAKIERYTVQSVLPVTDEAVLRKLGAYSFRAAAEEAGGESKEDDMSIYLQLPESLPSRVTALAAEVSGGGVTNRYDQVKAVETYLRSSYSYSAEESSVPPKDADFVDYFLFEQRKGYCVHFSSAMVVMLRSQGIPARWVKGFAPGELSSSDTGALTASQVDAGLAAYDVRAKDAHAWVEVYFPDAGWVPFDPTPGYEGVTAGAAAAAAALGEAGGGYDAPAAYAAGGGATDAAAWAKALLASAARRADALAHAAQEALKGAAAASPAAQAAAGAALLALAGIALAAARYKRLRLALALRRYGAAYAAQGARAREAGGRRAGGGRGFAHAQFAAVSAALWQLMHGRLSARPPHQTGREYAAAVAGSLPPARAEALRRFIDWDDAARYGQHDQWQAPQPEELAAAAQSLTGSKSHK